MAKKTSKKTNYVTIVVTKPRNVVGDDETVVSINGKLYQIQYDRPVSVPENVAEVIMSSQALQAKISKETELAKFTAGKRAFANL